VHLSIQQFVQMLRSMVRDIDPEFTHHLNGFGVHVIRWFRSGTFNVDHIAAFSTEDGFGHLATTRVSGAEDQN
jgi:hypothetical protein